MFIADSNGNTFAIYHHLEWERLQKTPYGNRVHTYTGVDSILILSDGSDAQSVHMRILESDGSESKMCGNGLLSVASLLRQDGLSIIETLSGRHEVFYTNDVIEVEIGKFHYRDSITMDGFRIHLTDVGEPHAITYIDEHLFESCGDEILGKLGTTLAVNGYLGEKWNFSIASPLPNNQILARTFERGVGNETLSCGTGASCIACCTKSLQLHRGEKNKSHSKTDPLESIRVLFRGGELEVVPGDTVRLRQTTPIKIQSHPKITSHIYE